MAKSRKQKNKKIYDDLEVELKNNKENSYEEKIKSIDPKINSSGTSLVVAKKNEVVKKNEQKNNSALTVIAKKVNGDKPSKKNELVVVNSGVAALNFSTAANPVDESQLYDFYQVMSNIYYTDNYSLEEVVKLIKESK